VDLAVVAEVNIWNPAHPLANDTFEQGTGDTQGVKAAFEARMFSSFEPPMRVSHHIDPQPSGI
jgi:hypothetical protein